MKIFLARLEDRVGEQRVIESGISGLEAVLAAKEVWNPWTLNQRLKPAITAVMLTSKEYASWNELEHR